MNKRKMINLVWMFFPLALCGCDESGWVNFFAPLEGQVTITFVNETPYRVITYWGGYNPLDPATDIDVRKLKLESGESSPAVINCTRRIEIAGESLKRAVEIGKPDGVSADDINEKIAFSDVNLGEDNDEEATAGEGDSVRYELGIDYSCSDILEIHFQQDPDTGKFIVTLKNLGH